MWSFIKRLLAGPTPPENPLSETICFDEAGFTRSGELARALGQQEFWPWSDIQEFGFRYTQAIYPDPWSGDYMEGLWFLRVPSDGGGLMAMELDEATLDVERLPPPLLHNMPGLDMGALRAGLAAAARGPRNFECAGEWVAWRRGTTTPPAAATAGPGPV
ncbi:hypothetical protein IPU70_18940 [Achromobacter sp. SD115]|uniref:hypothetical protein n=1 Tax=Achromobacter sp. SD115 TaxID=2782011 RepID=UPI001A960FC2|nr:hypothetical protein [Achromobacter sp. SD115]MBO1015647.1 hypothetical protein [Achromobacter sp. SD115]